MISTMNAANAILNYRLLRCVGWVLGCCGLMLAAGTGADGELLQIAVAAEAALKAQV